MTAPIPGSEVFSSRPIDVDALARSLPPSLPVHTVTQEQIDMRSGFPCGKRRTVFGDQRKGEDIAQMFGGAYLDGQGLSRGCAGIHRI